MSDFKYEAIYKFAPDAIKLVANKILRPPYLINLDIVSRKPKYISKIVLKDALELLEKTNDSKLLASFINVNDKRLKFRKALIKHKRYNQAKRLTLTMDHPWKNYKDDELFDIIKDEINESKNNNNNNSNKLNIGNSSYEKLITFLRSRSPIDKNFWYKKIYHNFKDLIFTGEIEIDVMINNDIGIKIEELLNDRIVPEVDYYKINHITSSTLNQMLSYYDHINLPLAKIIKSNNLKVDLSLIDHIDDDSANELLGTQASIQLFENGLIKDINLLLPIIADLTHSTRGRLAMYADNPLVFEALVDGMYYRSKYITNDIGNYLDSVPDMTTNALIICLSHCSGKELKDFFNNKYINKVTSNNIKLIIDGYYNGLIETQKGWYVNSIDEFINIIGDTYLTEEIRIGIEYLIEKSENNIPTILSNSGNIGKLAIEKIISEIGSNETSWDNLLRLAKDWNGNLETLIEMIKKI